MTAITEARLVEGVDDDPLTSREFKIVSQISARRCQETTQGRFLREEYRP